LRNRGPIRSEADDFAHTLTMDDRLRFFFLILLAAAVIDIFIDGVIDSILPYIAVQEPNDEKVRNPNATSHASIHYRPSQPVEKCTISCCVGETTRSINPYRPMVLGSPITPSIEDRVGIYETMKYLPEVQYRGVRNIVKNLDHVPLTQDIIPCLLPGTIILVETKNLEPFFEHMYPLLNQPFVLFSMNTDNSAPGKFSKYLNVTASGNNVILHWFASNCDLDAKIIDKLTCIPIGLAHNNDQKYVMNKTLSSISGLTYLRGQPRFPKDIEYRRKGLVLAAYTYPKGSRKYNERKALTEHMCGDKNMQLWKDENVTCTNVRGFENLYQVSLQYKFMLSPRGGGLDCYRTWEALHLGMAIVVKSSTLDSMYEGLPVLIVKEWSEITPELLHRTWESFQRQSFDFRRLYINFWQLEMARFRNDYRVTYKYRNNSFDVSKR